MSSGNDYCDGDGDNDDDEYSDGDDNIDGFAHNDFDDDDGDGVQATAGWLLFCGPNDSQEELGLVGYRSAGSIGNNTTIDK